MQKKQFKTESKKLLDMMINSIYTHKEIFLRELISNASDAIDKLYYRSLSDDTVGLSREDYAIRITADADARTLTVSDNGCGMDREALETNLGTIAKSGSFDFKKDNEAVENVDIIGQFGVGFYSAFMVADRITVVSRPYGSDEAWKWESEGADGYGIEACEKDGHGTDVILHLKADTDDEKYGEYLTEYRVRELVRKYSDYIRYPIRMEVSEERLKEGTEDEYETVKEEQTLNSMVPLWRKNPNEVTTEEYTTFYREKFYDYEEPVKTIHQRSEGTATYDALLFIPKRPPFDYYSGDFKKGLELYSSGVMIMEKCADLLPDYFSFVRGLVDSADLSLNISREMLQHDRQLRVIANAIEKKIKNELSKMMDADREKYEDFFKTFGIQLKYGIYADYGAHKDVLKDLVLFVSSAETKYVSLKEYVARAKEDQKTIYYACAETVGKAAMLPRAEAVVEKGFEVLYLTDEVDEFALRMLGEYEGKKFANVATEALDISTDEEKEEIKKENDDAKEMLDFFKESLDGVSAVKLSNTLKNHPVSLSTEGEISSEMEKVLNKMPGANGQVKASLVLEINATHPIAAKLRALYAEDREKAADAVNVLYQNARLISGMAIDDPSKLCDLVCNLML